MLEIEKLLHQKQDLGQKPEEQEEISSEEINLIENEFYEIKEH